MKLGFKILLLNRRKGTWVTLMSFPHRGAIIVPMALKLYLPVDIGISNFKMGSHFEIL